MLTQEELGLRLREVRESLGMTQDDVADHLGLSRPTVSQIESGRRAVSSIELDRLAAFFGHDIRDLLAPASTEGEALQALFRAQPDFELTADVRATLIAWRNKVRALADLEGLLGLPQQLCTATTYESPVPASRWAAIQQGEQAADAERARLGLGRTPIPNIQDIIESQGVRTALERLDDDVSGLTLLARGFLAPLVVVNADHAASRHRFSFAHEYAHVLLDRARAGGLVSRLENRNDLIEIRANAFAAAVLMPADGVREFVRQLGKGFRSRDSAEVYDDDATLPLRVEGRIAPASQDIQMYDVIEAAQFFDVSRLAMIYRLKNLRLISQPELDHLKTQEQTQEAQHLAELLGVQAPPEPSSLMSAFRRRFLATALEAYRRSLISQGKLEELGLMADLSRDQLRQLQALTGMSDSDH